MFKSKSKFKSLRTVLSVLCIGAGVLFLNAPNSSSSLSNQVHVIELEDASINPVTSEYITKAIDRAEDEDARLLVIQLDTPGGLLSSTRSIVKRMLTAKVPVAVYIAPGGSRAGSAGVFITYASHIAAMAPSTNIGAAHPIKMGGGSAPKKGDEWGELKKLLEDIRDAQKTGQDKEKSAVEAVDSKESETSETDSPLSEQSDSKSSDDSSEEKDLSADENALESKLLNDTVAFIKSIAKERNRNVDWAVQSVADSDSITSDEALEKGVVEYVATDLNDLLNQINGTEVMINGKTVVLDTKQVHVERIPMDGRQQFFNILANPNVAYFLMILGFYGLLFEVTHPGIGAPGILGAIFLILAFYSMQTLPTNYAGLALLVLGLVLLVSEAYTPTFGLLTLGGVVCLVLGSMLLFDSADPIMRVSKVVIAAFTISTAGISLFVLTYMLKAQRKVAKGGMHRVLGAKGVVQKEITEEQEGMVFVSGELWGATAHETIKKGEKIVVVQVDGLLLTVKKI